jgi:hypothetical protein
MQDMLANAGSLHAPPEECKKIGKSRGITIAGGLQTGLLPRLLWRAKS